MQDTVHVNTGDSRSCTSLSIWISMLTVISSSALEMLGPRFNGLRGELLTRFAKDCKPAHRPEQEGTKKMLIRHCDTKTGIGRRKTFGHPKKGSSVPVEDSNLISRVAYPRVKIPQALSHVRELRCSDKVVIQILYHDAGKFDILVR